MLPELGARASYLRALAFEAAGRVDDAILALEDLSDGDGPAQVTAAIALSRCYRETGDLARAIDTGERALRRLEEYQLDGSDEAVQLAVTIAAAHFERGDVDVRRPALPPGHRAGRAARLAQGQGLGVLERQRHGVRTRAPSTPRSRWPRRPSPCSSWGTTPATWPACARSSASASSGWTRPRSRTPGPTSSRPPSELAWSSASPTDSARNDIALARARYLAGDLEEAGARATQILESFRDSVPMVAADALILSGQVAADEGDVARAQAAYREAILTLTGIGADRTAAQLWFELGGLLEEVGAGDEALDAYRRAAASTGLTTRRASTRALA